MKTIPTTVEELLQPRVKLIIDSPAIQEVKDHIYMPNIEYIDMDGEATAISTTWHIMGADRDLEWVKQYPGIFSVIEWWEGYEKSIDVFTIVEYVKILFKDKPGYYVVGDIVPVGKYRISTSKDHDNTLRMPPSFIGYSLGAAHIVSYMDVVPATRQEWELAGKHKISR